MAYTTIKNGSTGADVKKLQAALNAAGYNAGKADGIYGTNTQKAVTAYQKANGLMVDGIAGNQTLSSLYGGSGSGTAAKKTTTAPAAPKAVTQGTTAPAAAAPAAGATGDVAATVPAATDAAALAAENGAAVPGTDAAALTAAQAANGYNSQYSPQIQATLDRILNRGEFNYDFNADPIYQNYRQQYLADGRRAMQDSMGEAAALTGGYGSSYGQQVGQQTYNQYVSELNNILPDLYQQAYDRYMQDGQLDRDTLALLQGMDDSDYNRYMDALQFEYQKAQDALAQQNWEKTFNAQYGKKKSSGGGGGSSKKSSGSGSTASTAATGTGIKMADLVAAAKAQQAEYDALQEALKKKKTATSGGAATKGRNQTAAIN